MPTARDRFFTQLKAALYEGTFAEMVLEKYQGLDRRMRAISVRQTSLLPGKQIITFIHIHEGHQTEKTFSLHEALAELQNLIGKTFLDAHLVCAAETYQLTFTLRGVASLKITPNSEMPSRPDATPAHDETSPASPPEPAASTAIPWNRALDAAAKKAGVLDATSFAPVFINEFLGWLTPLLEYAVRPAKKKTASAREHPITIVQLGSGRGQLAFALATTLGARARIHGIDANPALLDLCNRVAGAEGLINLAFTKPPAPGAPAPEFDVLIALNARDTDADDALAQGIASGAPLIIVEPCAHRELRAQLPAPAHWPEAIHQETLLAHQTGPITDAFRALILACAGYKIKTLERPTSANSAPNLLIAALKPRIRPQEVTTDSVRAFARHHGIRHQHLAKRLGLAL